MPPTGFWFLYLPGCSTSKKLRVLPHREFCIAIFMPVFNEYWDLCFASGGRRSRLWYSRLWIRKQTPSFAELKGAFGTAQKVKRHSKVKPRGRAGNKSLIIISVAFFVMAGAGLLFWFPPDGKMPDGKMDVLEETVAGYVPVYKWRKAGGAKARRLADGVRQKNTILLADMKNPYLAGARTVKLFCKIDASEAIVEQWRSAVCRAVSVRLEQGLKIPVEITRGARLPAGGDQGIFGVLNIEVNAALGENQISGNVKWATSIIQRGVTPQEQGGIVMQSVSGDFQSDSNDFADKLVNTIPFFNWR